MESLTLAGILLSGAAVVLGWFATRAAQETSLVAAARWETFSLVAIGAVEVWGGAAASDEPSVWLAPLRWLAATTVFCGWMARLGARRPHNAGWQLVVASLWGILALPAAEVFFLQRGQSFEIHAARGAFLWILVAGGLFNSLPTRGWWAGTLAAVGQVILLAEHLPGVRFVPAQASTTHLLHTLALALLSVGQIYRALPGRPTRTRPGLTGVWLDFRDQFGAWWGLRVVERVNAVAQQERWPVRLAWHGFVAEPSRTTNSANTTNLEHDVAIPPLNDPLDALTTAQRESLHQTLWNLLRRFVTPEWMGEEVSSGGRGESREE